MTTGTLAGWLSAHRKTLILGAVTLVAYAAAINRTQALVWGICALFSATLIAGFAWPRCSPRSRTALQATARASAASRPRYAGNIQYGIFGGEVLLWTLAFAWTLHVGWTQRGTTDARGKRMQQHVLLAGGLLSLVFIRVWGFPRAGLYMLAVLQASLNCVTTTRRELHLGLLVSAVTFCTPREATASGNITAPWNACSRRATSPARPQRMRANTCAKLLVAARRSAAKRRR